MKKVCFVVSSLATANVFLRDYIAALSSGYRVLLIANTSEGRAVAAAGVDAELIGVPIERKISPMRDLWALVRLVGIFRRQRFDIVHSVTTKAALLAMMAAWMTRVPVRLNTFTGQLWVTRKGPMRWLLYSVDRLIAGCATHILIDSPSQRDFLLASGIVSAAKSAVLANGSICGVDGERFRPDPAARTRIRSELGIPGGAVVFLYLGRLTKEKGVLDLAKAFAKLVSLHPSAQLVLVGPDEDGLKPQIREGVPGCERCVHWVDYTARPEEYMAAADVFCLPSYREGFGQAAIEASAVGLPVIASRIYGVTDAVVDGETGLLCAPGDVDALLRHMRDLASNPTRRHELGEAGRRRAERDFSRGLVTRALFDYYASLTRQL